MPDHLFNIVLCSIFVDLYGVANHHSYDTRYYSSSFLTRLSSPPNDCYKRCTSAIIFLDLFAVFFYT